MAKQIGQIIKKYREKNKMSLRAFAEKSGVAKSYIARIENFDVRTGKPPVPSLEITRAFADAMEMDRTKLYKMIGIEVIENQTQEESAPPIPSHNKLEPFKYIPLTQSNLNDAAREMRLIILPFKAPRLGGNIYLPYYENGGMVLMLEIRKVSGGIYSAWHEAVGDVEFNLFDIDKTIFMTRSLAYEKIEEWKRNGQK